MPFNNEISTTWKRPKRKASMPCQCQCHMHAICHQPNVLCRLGTKPDIALQSSCGECWAHGQYVQATSSNPYEYWGSWQITRRSDQLPLSAFAKENHIPTAVTACHRHSFNSEHINENTVNMAKYSVETKVAQWCAVVYHNSNLIHRSLPVPNDSQWFPVVPSSRPYFSKPTMTRCLRGGEHQKQGEVIH